MELTDYLRIFRKRGWIVILVALVAAASAFSASSGLKSTVPLISTVMSACSDLAKAPK